MLDMLHYYNLCGFNFDLSNYINILQKQTILAVELTQNSNVVAPTPRAMLNLLLAQGIIHALLNSI